MPDPKRYRRNPWEVSTAPSVTYRPAVQAPKQATPDVGTVDQIHPDTFEAKVNRYLGNPKGRAFDYAETLAEVNPDETIGDQPDNCLLYTSDAADE